VNIQTKQSSSRFQLTLYKHAVMKSSYSSFQSSTNKQELSNENNYEAYNQKELCMQQRRLSRLYGSSANIRKGRIKNNENMKEGSQQKTSENKKTQPKPKPKRRGTMEKFADRKIVEMDLEIHHNHDIEQPWYSGYQNKSSICGCPQALASR